MRTRILVVDDEEPMCEILRFNLEKEGYDVETAYSAEEALEVEDLETFDLVISDIMMDNLSGYDLVKRLRYNPRTEHLPVILCSALDSEDTVVKGLNIGADDYITKPFSKSEVIARVKAVLRRSRTPENVPAHHYEQPVIPPKTTIPVNAPVKTNDDEIVFHELRLDRNQKACFLRGEDLQLTPSEYNVLLFFLTHRNKIFSRDEIIKEVWGSQTVGPRTVDTNLTRIKAKLKDYSKYIHTRAGFGYAFKETI